MLRDDIIAKDRTGLATSSCSTTCLGVISHEFVHSQKAKIGGKNKDSNLKKDGLPKTENVSELKLHAQGHILCFILRHTF